MKTKDITKEMVEAEVNYNKETGEFSWKRPLQGRRKSAFGRQTSTGYAQVRLFGRQIFTHRLAWLIVHGSWPKGQVDHINGNPADNRIENLRDVSPSINQQNQRRAHKKNKCGLLGAHFNNDGRYTSRIWVEGKRVYLGSFRTKEEAHTAYVNAKRVFHAGCAI